MNRAGKSGMNSSAYWLMPIAFNQSSRITPG